MFAAVPWPQNGQNNIIGCRCCRFVWSVVVVVATVAVVLVLVLAFLMVVGGGILAVLSSLAMGNMRHHYIRVQLTNH